jgi:hypothetical protein
MRQYGFGVLIQIMADFEKMGFLPKKPRGGDA